MMRSWVALPLLVMLLGCVSATTLPEADDTMSDPSGPDRRASASSQPVAPDSAAAAGLADVAPTVIRPVVIDPSRPVALHFAMLPGAPNAPTPMPDGPATAALRSANVENIVVTSQLPSAPAAAASGALIARHTPARVIQDPTRTDTLLAHIDDVIGLVRTRLREGYAYLAIDELEPEKADFLKDSDPRSDKLVAALKAMDADADLRRRVILYANSYNMAGSNFNDFTMFSKVLRACRDYCRVVASEMYLGTNEGFLRGAAMPRTAAERGGCANGVDCMGFVVNKMDVVAPGIKTRTITVLAVDDRWMKSTDTDAYCKGRASLRAQIAKARTIGQPGVGTYSLARVAGDALSQSAFDVARMSFTTCWRTSIDAMPFPLIP